MTDVKPARTTTANGMANGYRFQDAIGAELLLASLSEPGMRITFETKSHDNDKYDDLIIDHEGEIIRLQCKNGPEFTPTDAAWRSGRSRGIKWNELCASIESHLADYGDNERFVLLTSFNAPDDLKTKWIETGSVHTMPGREYRCYARNAPLDKEAIETTARLEVVFNAEHHNAQAEKPREEEDPRGIQESPWWAEALACVTRSPPQIDNPHLAQPAKILDAALSAANRFRAAGKQQATGDDAAEAMHIAAGSFHLQQEPPAEEFAVIEPHWIADVQGAINQSASRIWLVGPPGCGKSTAIQHLANNEESITYRLYHPGDSPDDVRIRLQPVIFRHELAGILDRHYPETIPLGLKADSSLHAIKERLEAIASSISNDELGPLVIFDGLDHDFREGNRGKLVKNLLEIPFPPEFRVLFLSRPLESVDDIQGFEQISLPLWQIQDIKKWLNANGQSDNEDVAKKLEVTSGGLPLILSMMLRRAIGEEEKLVDVAVRFGKAEGVLDDFLSKLLAETRPAIHDALAFLVVHTHPMRQDMLKAAMGLPSVAADVFSGHGLQSICKMTNREVELPHAYLAQFIKQQAKSEKTWESRLHAAQQRMLQFCTDRFKTAALNNELLTQLLEDDEEIRELARGIGPETLVQWAKAGVHEETARDALQTVFRLGAKIHDPLIMMRTALLADRVQNLFEIDTSASQRLHFFAASGDIIAGERLALQIIRQEDRNSMEAADSILQAIIYLHEHALENKTMDDVKSLHEELSRSHGSGGLSWEHALTAKARLDKPEGFWELAGKAVEQHEGSLGIKMTIFRSAPKDERGFIIGPEKPPAWLVSNPADAIRTCAWLLPIMPKKWIEQIHDIASTHTPASLAESFSVALLVPSRRSGMSAYKQEQLTIPHYDLHPGEPPHADAFYLGALAAWVGDDMEQIRNRLVENVGEDGTAQHMLLAALGAWMTSPGKTMGQETFKDKLAFFAQLGTVGNVIKTLDTDRSASASFAYVVSLADEDELLSSLPADLSDLARSAGFPNLVSEIERVVLQEKDEEAAVQRIAAKRNVLLTIQPDEFGPCRELVNLAIAAAELGYQDLAVQCFADGLTRGFRYGHRKDIFLIDVWKALIEVDPDLKLEYGLAIQLLNWSRHLHTVTDGKYTRWFEGQILEKFLDLHLTDLQTALDVADSPHTKDLLVDWSIKNETIYDKEKWDEILMFVRQTSRGWEDKKSSRLVRLAEQAFERHENELGCQLLHEAVDSYRSTSRFNEGDLLRFRKLAAAHEPELVGKIEIKEDRHERDLWSPKTRIGEESVKGYLNNILTRSSIDELTKGFQDLWGSREEEQREHALTVLATIMEKEPERGWQVAEQTLMESSKMDPHWGSGFQHLCDFLIKIDAERTQRAALNAWRNDSIQGRPYGYGNLPNLCWLVDQVRGRETAIAILHDAVAILSRSLEPHQHRVQVWGRIQDTWLV